MRSRLLAGAATLALAAAGLTMITAGPASADCGHPWHDNEYSGGGISFKAGGGTPIRSGPHGTCEQRGTGFEGEGIDVYCAILWAEQNRRWVYVRDLSDGTQGWARASALQSPGRNVDACWSDVYIYI